MIGIWTLVGIALGWIIGIVLHAMLDAFVHRNDPTLADFDQVIREVYEREAQGER